MTMGEMIKFQRKKLKLSQEELGNSLEPPVNKAAVQKWENGTVENLKRTHIQQLANKFHITPSDLMCWNDTPESDSTKAELSKILIELNQSGQDELLRYAHYLRKRREYLTGQDNSTK